MYEYLSNRTDRLVGFFPGLGSRAFYHDLGPSLLDSGFPEIKAIYREAGQVLGRSDPHQLLLNRGNMPSGRLEEQGFIGAAFILHSLALDAHLRASSQRAGVALNMAAYAGESLGIVTAAIAGGSLSIGDGTKIAHAFTPLMLSAAEGNLTSPLAQEMSGYLPETSRGQALVPEPSHVIALIGEPHDITAVLDALALAYARTDVEVHKRYSRRQANIYVRAGVRQDFEVFVSAFPAVRTEELKPPTTFLAHSQRMHYARLGLAKFLDAHKIVFRDPHTPVVSNNDKGLFITGKQIRRGVLALADEVMGSQGSAALIDSLRPDIVVEFGLGGKSVRLLTDNNVAAPVVAYDGTTETTAGLLHSVRKMSHLLAVFMSAHTAGKPLEAQHFQSLRDHFRLAAGSEFHDRYLFRTMQAVIKQAVLSQKRDGSPELHQLLEAFQHTCAHRDYVNVSDGELVLRARLKKKAEGNPDGVGQAYTEFQVIDAKGDIADRCSADMGQPEAVVVHFGPPAEFSKARLYSNIQLLLSTQPLARQIFRDTRRSVQAADRLDIDIIIYQYALFCVLRACRRSVFAQADLYLKGDGQHGWLVTLAASGAISTSGLVHLYTALQDAEKGDDRARKEVERLLSSLGKPEIPIISHEGIPLYSSRDLEAATYAVMEGDAFRSGSFSIHLNGNCQVISLGPALDPACLDLGGRFRSEVLSVDCPAELWTRHINRALDNLEDSSTLRLTRENGRVLRYAQSHRIRSSTIYTYVDITETVVGFGEGGSESLTLFVVKQRENGVTVRKILSEAITTAKWSPKGEGVMLPPVVKVKKQVEYLNALPGPVRDYFPSVRRIAQRETPSREFSYDMSYVDGETVSGFVARYSPPPVLVAHLYEQILRLLDRQIHTVRRTLAPGNTVEVSYFQKIEDRLELCRRTAPATFGPQLLDTEYLVINNVRYLNSRSLLRRLRDSPRFLAALEPPFHSLVMGDTNTENIKIVYPEPLLHAQRLIEAGAKQEDIDSALSAVTPESLGITFLDPRAIGFNSDGVHTQDDPMYDTKIWHNSIGHYDEIHNEFFTLDVETRIRQDPQVSIKFLAGNPYQNAYRLENYFAPVMTAVYDLDDPRSTHLRSDPHWLTRFAFLMGTHFAAMPPFHFQAEMDGTLTDTYQVQRRPVAVYCEGIKWLNWSLEMLEGKRTEFLGLPVYRRTNS